MPNTKRYLTTLLETALSGITVNSKAVDIVSSDSDRDGQYVHVYVADESGGLVEDTNVEHTEITFELICRVTGSSDSDMIDAQGELIDKVKKKLFVERDSLPKSSTFTELEIQVVDIVWDSVIPAYDNRSKEALIMITGLIVINLIEV